MSDKEFKCAGSVPQNYNEKVSKSVTLSLQNTDNKDATNTRLKHFTDTDPDGKISVFYRESEGLISYQRVLTIVSVGKIYVGASFSYSLTDKIGRPITVPKVSNPTYITEKPNDIMAYASVDQNKKALFKVTFAVPTNAILIVSPRRDYLGETLDFILTQSYNQVNPIYPIPVLKLSSVVSPTINIRVSTDIYSGRDLGQVVYNISDGTTVSKYIKDINIVLKLEGCSFVSKTLNLSYDTINNILIYGTLRYVLCWLLFGVWDMNLLRNRYNYLFYTALSRSKYKSFIEEFKILKDTESYYRY